MTKTNYFYFCTATKIKDNLLIPRIPESSGENEDKTIPRICVSTGIKKCMIGLGYHGTKYPLIMYVYKINRNSIPEENIVTNKEIIQNGYVKDADKSNEHWIINQSIKLDEPETILYYTNGTCIKAIESETRTILLQDVNIIYRISTDVDNTGYNITDSVDQLGLSYKIYFTKNCRGHMFIKVPKNRNIESLLIFYGAMRKYIYFACHDNK